MSILEPRDEKDLVEAIAAAVAAQTPLRLVGMDSRAGFGRTMEAQAELRLRSLAGIVFYEPQELVLRARAGTPLSEILAAVDEHAQMLAFEPMDHGRFFDGAPGGGTIGGMIAVNASGPRRIKVGAARDHLLGFRGVTGRGDLIASGGRVMKNVTGYDLCKLVAGSHGGLVALSEVTVKVLPRPETESTVIFTAPDEAKGLAILREATGLPLDISGFALSPGGAGQPARGVLRLEGSPLSVRKRLDALFAAMARWPDADILEPTASAAYWRALRDAEAVRQAEGDVWRLSVTPSAAAAAVESIRRADVDISAHDYDWAGGLIWLAARGQAEMIAPIMRRAAAEAGGHATLMRASVAARLAVPVFHPQPAPLAALTARVKDAFDPLRLLNRGRMRPDL